MLQSRRIVKQFVSIEQREGVGATVRRSIGHPKLRRLDPFLMLDEFHVSLPGGFPDHPHRGFETITYLLPTSPGKMLHEDFCGHRGELVIYIFISTSTTAFLISIIYVGTW